MELAGNLGSTSQTHLSRLSLEVRTLAVGIFIKCILLLSGTVKAAGSGGQQGYKVEFLGQECPQSWSGEWVHTDKFLAIVPTTWRAFGSGRGGRGGILIRRALLCGVCWKLSRKLVLW